MAFIGDSFIAGAGDENHQGWPGRLCATTPKRSYGEFTVYNLGVRRNTSTDVRQRWETEIGSRLQNSQGYLGILVFSFGTNDCIIEDGQVRVPVDTAIANAEAILSRAKTLWPTLMIGPPPSTSYGDSEVNRRILHMDTALASCCRRLDVPFLSVARQLMNSSAWCSGAAEGDGIHPNGQGYGVLADQVLRWDEWRQLFAHI